MPNLLIQHKTTALHLYNITIILHIVPLTQISCVCICIYTCVCTNTICTETRIYIQIHIYSFFYMYVCKHTYNTCLQSVVFQLLSTLLLKCCFLSYLVMMGSAAWFGPHRPKSPRPTSPVRPAGFLEKKSTEQVYLF